MIFSIIAAICLLLSAIFSFTAAIGLIRLPDLYTRMHAASKAGTLGSGFALLSIAFLADEMPIVLRAIAGILFFILTTPISSHLLARAALISRNAPMQGHVENNIAFEPLKEEE